MSIKLRKLLNEYEGVLSFEIVTVMDQIYAPEGKLPFRFLEIAMEKIGMNTTANKLC